MNKDVIREVKLKISSAKVDEAIELLVESCLDTEFETEVLLLSSRYKSIINESTKGIIDDDYGQKHLNRIISSVLEICIKISDSQKTVTIKNSFSARKRFGSKKNSFKPNEKLYEDSKSNYSELDDLLNISNSASLSMSDEEYFDLLSERRKAKDVISSLDEEVNKLYEVSVKKRTTYIRSLFLDICQNENSSNSTSVIEDVMMVRSKTKIDDEGKLESLYSIEDKQVIIFAIFLSAYKEFEISKVDLLIDFLYDKDEDVKATALTSLTVLICLFQSKVTRHKYILDRISEFRNNPSIQKGLINIERIIISGLYRNDSVQNIIDRSVFFKDPYNWFRPFSRKSIYYINFIENCPNDIDIDFFENLLDLDGVLGCVKKYMCAGLATKVLEFTNDADTNNGKKVKNTFKVVNNNVADRFKPYCIILSTIFYFLKKENISKDIESDLSKRTLSISRFNKLAYTNNALLTLQLIHAINDGKKDRINTFSKKLLKSYDDSNYDSVLLLGRALYTIGKFKEAAILFDKAYSLENKQKILEFHIKALYYGKQFTKVAKFRKRKELIDEYDIFCIILDSLYKINKYKQCIKYSNHRIDDLEKSDYWLVASVGMCLSSLDKNKKAIKLLEKSKVMMPSNWKDSAIDANLAFLYLNINDYSMFLFHKGELLKHITEADVEFRILDTIRKIYESEATFQELDKLDKYLTSIEVKDLESFIEYLKACYFININEIEKAREIASTVKRVEKREKYLFEHMLNKINSGSNINVQKLLTRISVTFHY